MAGPPGLIAAWASQGRQAAFEPAPPSQRACADRRPEQASMGGRPLPREACPRAHRDGPHGARHGDVALRERYNQRPDLRRSIPSTARGQGSRWCPINREMIDQPLVRRSGIHPPTLEGGYRASRGAGHPQSDRSVGADACHRGRWFDILSILTSSLSILDRPRQTG